MRIALTTALMLVATLALADEPTPAESKTEATAQAPAETPAAQPAQSESVAKADENADRFKPPAGYRPKRVNGVQVWCTKTVVLGSKFPKEDCRNEAELRELIRTRASMRDDLNQRRPCAGGGCVTN